MSWHPTVCCSAAPSWASPNDTRRRLAVLRVFNWHGDFDNLGDTAEGLRQVLEESFETVGVDVVGSTESFTATGPRRAEERI